MQTATKQEYRLTAGGSKTHLEKARTAICRSLSIGNSAGYWISSGLADFDPPNGEIIAVLRDRALFVDKDAASNLIFFHCNGRTADHVQQLPLATQTGILNKGTYSNVSFQTSIR